VPIQIATFDVEEYRRIRRDFTTDEWIDLMLRSMGYEPAAMEKRLKLHFLVRLIPLAERNFNLVELGPRGTGKSYVVQEISPYAALLTGVAHRGGPVWPHGRQAEGPDPTVGRGGVRRSG
jgi:ATP-dependent Lon protease